MADSAARQVDRAKLIDEGFVGFVSEFDGGGGADLSLKGSGLESAAFLELFESQLLSRQLDLLARRLRLKNQVFYTIGSSGHEGNAVLGRLLRKSDPAFLHYRSGALMLERSRQVPGIDPVYDTALSFAASAEDPASGGRHKVWGSGPLWVIPQTSTIASHLPKAMGAARAIEHAARIGAELPVPADSVVLCSFGDASLNHSTAQGAINAAQWASHQGIGVPVVFVCEDNRWGISVNTPAGWVERSTRDRPALDWFEADGLNLASAYRTVEDAVTTCRQTRRPVFLRFNCVRLLGHAGTDFEVDYRQREELETAEAADPLRISAALALNEGLLSPEAVLELYQQARERCEAAAARASERPRLTSLAEVAAPLAPPHTPAVKAEALRVDEAARSIGHNDKLPELSGPANLSGNINRALRDLLIKYPQAMIFGEDVAQKGGVYTVTRGLHRQFGGSRVFNTLLDEQTILGLAQGYGTLGLLPIPEIQYLAYFHNAGDQIRGEASSTRFFSDGHFRSPMLLRVAGLGYQKGFGGHFHNDTSITALRDIPGICVACPSRGDDAAAMLRMLAAGAVINGDVNVFIEPIALYMTRDLYEDGDRRWLFEYPSTDTVIAPGEPRIYEPFATDLLIVTYGNGVPMSLRAARQLKAEQGLQVQVMDLRWLVPLNETAIIEQARRCGAVLVVDEGRRSGAIAEGVLAALAEAGLGIPVARLCGADCFTPLGPASATVLPSESTILDHARAVLARGDSPAAGSIATAAGGGDNDPARG
ncbi:MAG: transketolase C-terminal domain-containing protein [Pseudomonadota bacterium]